MTETRPFEPTWTSSPGDTIADLLREHGWSAAEFAERMGYTPKHVNELLHGRASITAETAIRLEQVLGSTALFWMSRESQYREAQARHTSKTALQDEHSWLRRLPIKQMIRRGWVPKMVADEDQVAEGLKFFGVASVRAWSEIYLKPVEQHAAFRNDARHAMDVGAVVAWLRKAELDAATMKTRPWSKSGFKAALASIRELTLVSDPEVFLPELREICAANGVAFVLLRTVDGCPVSGATRFLSPEKALLVLTARNLRDDGFWFSFFHEAGHLLLHAKRTLFLELPSKDGTEEKEADRFAQDMLIPPNRRSELKSLKHTNEVRAFAADIGVCPGIVVGALHHERIFTNAYARFSKLVGRFDWSGEN